MSRRATIRTTAATAAALTCALTPVFLFAALSEQIGAELGFGDAAAGAVITVFFVASALGAVPAGYVTERIGTRPAMLLGTALAGLASAALGGLAMDILSAAALLAIAGSAVGLIDTGGARAFTEVVSPRRQGVAFGIKEASVPAASAVAGAAVPLLGLTVGWRPTFALTLVLIPLVWFLLPAPMGTAGPVASGVEPHRPSRRWQLLTLVGSAAGTGAATATTAFLVRGGVTAGLSPGAAGTLLAIASACGISTRLVAGQLADRSPRSQLPVVAWLLIAGAAGPALLASGRQTATIVGALVALGAGWGWIGLLYLTAVRADPTAPAAAAGVVLTGVSIGGATGPLTFGLVVERAGFTAGWALTSIAMLVGGGAMLTAHSLRQTPDVSQTPPRSQGQPHGPHQRRTNAAIIPRLPSSIAGMTTRSRP